MKTKTGKITEEEFNAMVNGPLFHPLGMFCITRLAAALRFVVEATSAAGAEALREHCRQREEQDQRKGGG